MIRDTYRLLETGTEVRAQLAELRSQLKEEANRRAMQYELAGNTKILTGLLKHEDAKVRKNAALVMGQLGMQEFAPYLWEAYQREETRFVRGAYLSGLYSMDTGSYLSEMEDRMQKLCEMEPEPEEKKHRDEEMRELSRILEKTKGAKKHRFSGYDKPCQLIMLVNPLHREATVKELEKLPKEACSELRMLRSGLMFQTEMLKEVCKIRTFSECLFSFPGKKSVSKETEEIASEIAGEELLAFLTSMHREGFPFSFRLECKARMTLEERSAFLKEIAIRVEQKSQRKLQNSTSDYEVEIRMVENKEGRFNLMVKLYTMPDLRFSYRIASVSESIRPVNAALFMALFDQELKENARVLDPFCGVGTMLIERNKRKSVHTMYGIDHYGPAIEGAKRNAGEAKQILHLIQKDFFDFRHDYRFDEIISDLPRLSSSGSEGEIEKLYGAFMERIREFLEPGGKLFFYTYHCNELMKAAKVAGFVCKRRIELVRKQGYAMLFQECEIPG